MRTSPTRILLATAGLLALAAAGLWWMPAGSVVKPVANSSFGEVLRATPAPDESADPVAEPDPAKPSDPVKVRQKERSFMVAEKLLARLKTPLALAKARPNEAILTFKDAEAYRRFLARAGAAGLRILGRMDGLNTVRVGYGSLAALEADLNAHSGDYAGVDPNYTAYPPEVPEAETRFAGKFVPLGNNLLPFLGATGDTANWGKGVTIAILDSGLVADPTFGTGRVRYLDIGQGTVPTVDNGHGTAVASIAAGMDSDAMGVAPAASLLSIRVTGADGLGDSFTIAQAINAAVDNGAQVINISMGSYGNSAVMNAAVDYATARGVVIVASAGNDQTPHLTWPAADSRVISVGAVDAAEQQLTFSNSGGELKLTAPGYGIQTAWVNGTRIYMDGTSASAPVVSGGIAAMMSQNPGLSAAEAVSILERYASDGGPVGHDPDYGDGIINLGWAMNRNNFNRNDTAVSSQYFDPSLMQMQFVVQNRSANTVSGLNLSVAAGMANYNLSVPTLAPGGTFPVSVPVDALYLQTNGRIDYRTDLVNPPGFVDAVPGNNQRANSVTVVKPRSP